MQGLGAAPAETSDAVNGLSKLLNKIETKQRESARDSAKRAAEAKAAAKKAEEKQGAQATPETKAPIDPENVQITLPTSDATAACTPARRQRLGFAPSFAPTWRACAKLCNSG